MKKKIPRRCVRGSRRDKRLIVLTHYRDLQHLGCSILKLRLEGEGGGGGVQVGRHFSGNEPTYYEPALFSIKNFANIIKYHKMFEDALEISALALGNYPGFPAIPGNCRVYNYPDYPLPVSDLCLLLVSAAR